MPIDIITNFQLSDSKPLDNRLIATNSNIRESIGYKYDGMKVFQLDNRKSYVWNQNGATWSVDGDGTISSGSTNSIPYWMSPSTIGTSSVYFNGGNVGINVSNPKELFQVNTSYNGGSQPLVIHKSNVASIAYNWYYESTDKVFDAAVGSSKITFDDNSIYILNRNLNTPQSSFTQSLSILPNKIGINTSNPRSVLDVGIFSTSSIPLSIDVKTDYTQFSYIPYATIGYNYYTKSNGFAGAFDSAKGSSVMKFFNNSISFTHRSVNDPETSYVGSLQLGPYNSYLQGTLSITNQLFIDSLSTTLSVTSVINALSGTVSTISNSLVNTTMRTANLEVAAGYACASFSYGYINNTIWTGYPGLTSLKQYGGFSFINGGQFIQVPAYGVYKIEIYAKVSGYQQNANLTLYTHSNNQQPLQVGFTSNMARITQCIGGESVVLNAYYEFTQANGLGGIGLSLFYTDVAAYNVIITGNIIITRMY